MNSSNKILYFQLKKTGDKVIHITESTKTRYDLLIKSLEEGRLLDVFMESSIDSGTLAQLALIHVSIRLLAQESGSTFEDMKLSIKYKSGLCIKKELDGELYQICKSLGDCSKEELIQVIETINQVALFLNINLPL